MPTEKRELGKIGLRRICGDQLKKGGEQLGKGRKKSVNHRFLELLVSVKLEERWGGRESLPTCLWGGGDKKRTRFEEENINSERTRGRKQG